MGAQNQSVLLIKTQLEILPKQKLHNTGQKVGDNPMIFSKIGFLGTVLQLLFCKFLPKNVKFWLFGGWLGTHH